MALKNNNELYLISQLFKHHQVVLFFKKKIMLLIKSHQVMKLPFFQKVNFIKVCITALTEILILEKSASVCQKIFEKN